MKLFQSLCAKRYGSVFKSKLLRQAIPLVTPPNVGSIPQKAKTRKTERNQVHLNCRTDGAVRAEASLLAFCRVETEEDEVKCILFKTESQKPRLFEPKKPISIIHQIILTLKNANLFVFSSLNRNFALSLQRILKAYKYELLGNGTTGTDERCGQRYLAG